MAGAWEAAPPLVGGGAKRDWGCCWKPGEAPSLWGGLMRLEMLGRFCGSEPGEGVGAGGANWTCCWAGTTPSAGCSCLRADTGWAPECDAAGMCAWSSALTAVGVTGLVG